MSDRLQRTKPASFNAADWQKRQQAKAEVMADKSSPNNVTQIVARLVKVETALGLR